MRSILKVNKKGSGVFQILIILIILFIAALVGLLCYMMSDKVTTAFQETGVLANAPVANQSNTKIQHMLPYITDETIFFIFLFGNIALIIAATKTNFSAVTIFVFAIMGLMSILIAAGIVEVYSGFAVSDAASAYSSHLTLTNVIFSKFAPLFMCIMGFIMIIIMYGKSGQAQQW